MTTTTEFPPFRLPSETVGDITRQAREVTPGRVLLSVIGGLLFALGWIVAKLFGVLWFSMVWCGVAVRAGFRDARGKPPPGPSIEQVLRENARLRAEIARVS